MLVSILRVLKGVEAKDKSYYEYTLYSQSFNLKLCIWNAISILMSSPND